MSKRITISTLDALPTITNNYRTVFNEDVLFTGARDILMTDNTASALTIGEASNGYMKFDTTNSSELVTVQKPLKVSDNVTFEGDLTISGQHDISMDDNTANAVVFKENTNTYLEFNTTNGAENVTVGQDLVQNPGSSVTPANNGELVVEATNNTTLTFKLKGSDGTVRSGTITLS